MDGKAGAEKPIVGPHKTDLVRHDKRAISKLPSSYLTSRILDQSVKRPFMYINCQLLHPLPLPVVLLNANHVNQKKKQ